MILNTIVERLEQSGKQDFGISAIHTTDAPGAGAVSGSTAQGGFQSGSSRPHREEYASRRASAR
ncbi:hypothetical protein ABL57_11720 [Kocuria sp. SM24M-10]|nr:hypothetical protein ABL57_11720 [Kocuria sp. SM24M-10]